MAKRLFLLSDPFLGHLMQVDMALGVALQCRHVDLGDAAGLPGLRSIAQPWPIVEAAR